MKKVSRRNFLKVSGAMAAAGALAARGGGSWPAVPVHPLRLLPAQHPPALQQVPQQPVRTSLHLWATSP